MHDALFVLIVKRRGGFCDIVGAEGVEKEEEDFLWWKRCAAVNILP